MGKKSKSGQSLVEVLIATAMGAVIIGAVVASIILSMRSNAQGRTTSTAASLASGLLDNVQSLSDGDWQAIYGLSVKGATSTYYLVTTGTPPTISVASGTESVVINNVGFTRSFSVQDVYRTSCGTGSITTSSPTNCSGGSGVLEDPSTQLVIATVSWINVGGATSSISVSSYITHSKDRVTQYSNWSGSSGVSGPLTSPSSDYATSSNVMATSGGALQLQSY
ncbi:MAG: prepilin-type N-terminal cleavage/methylation domain-containing protein [Patescibacteria group bacterium]|nr:prepilin-type N-terminal cleavage/methylation domain-containing protein [Patescibacteria group bacterium]